MIRRYAVAVMAMVALGFVVVAPAQAGGGGGAKKTVTMRIKNTSTVANVSIGVLPYLPTANIADLAGLASLGGVVLNPGQITQFKYAPGASTVAALNTSEAAAAGYFPVTAADIASYNFNGSGSATGYLNVSATATTKATLPTFAGSATKF